MADGPLQNMYSIEIKSSLGNYFVEFDYTNLELDFRNVILIKDANVKTPECLQLVENQIQVTGNEELKTLDAASNLLSQLSALKANRNTLLIAIGGGSVQDICTLVASLYMRGINWIYIPTTLMAIADSCIGGKSSINVGKIKNLIGNFYPPMKIIVDLDYVDTLSKQSIASGLLEAVKINFAKNPAQTESWMLLSNEWLKSEDRQLLLDSIVVTLESKKWFIEIDEFDKKERKLLNFGHSFGHALESAMDMKIQHGLAVGLGMLCALRFSESKSKPLENYIKSLLKWCNFRSTDFIFNSDKFKSALALDKKNSAEIQRLVILDGNNSLTLRDFELKPVFLEQQSEVMLEILGDYK